MRARCAQAKKIRRKRNRKRKMREKSRRKKGGRAGEEISLSPSPPPLNPLFLSSSSSAAAAGSKNERRQKDKNQKRAPRGPKYKKNDEAKSHARGDGTCSTLPQRHRRRWQHLGRGRARPPASSPPRARRERAPRERAGPGPGGRKMGKRKPSSSSSSSSPSSSRGPWSTTAPKTRFLLQFRRSISRPRRRTRAGPPGSSARGRRSRWLSEAGSTPR